MGDKTKVDDKKVLKVLLSTLKKCGVKKGLDELDLKAAKKLLTTTLAEGKMPEELSKEDVAILDQAGFEVDKEESTGSKDKDKSGSSSGSSSGSASKSSSASASGSASSASASGSGSASGSKSSSASASGSAEETKEEKKPKGKPAKKSKEESASGSASGSASSSASAEEEKKPKGKEKPAKEKPKKDAEERKDGGKDWFRAFWEKNKEAKRAKLISAYTKKFGDEKESTVKSYINRALAGKFEFGLKEADGVLKKTKGK